MSGPLSTRLAPDFFGFAVATVRAHADALLSQVFDDPTRRAEATKTPEARRGWDEPRHLEASEAKATTANQCGTGATAEGVRAEARRREQEGGADPGNGPVRLLPVRLSGRESRRT